MDAGGDQPADRPRRPRVHRQAREAARRRQCGPALKSAIKKANIELDAAGIKPISERVSPHSLRRTFASLRFALGHDPIQVAEQGGWKDPASPIGSGRR